MDEFFPPYIFIVNADSKNSNNSKKTQTNNAIIKIFLDIISKLVNKPKKKGLDETDKPPEDIYPLY